MNSARSELIVNTVEIFPHNTKIPFVSSADPYSLVAVYLTEVLLHPNPEAPLSHIGETQLESLIKPVTLFNPDLKNLVHLQVWYRHHHHKM